MAVTIQGLVDAMNSAGFSDGDLPMVLGTLALQAQRDGLEKQILAIDAETQTVIQAADVQKSELRTQINTITAQLNAMV